MVTADDVPVSKPDPASYALAVERLRQVFPEQNMEASSCVAIEDTPAGIQSAHGAGLKVLAVTNSYAKSQLSDAEACVSSLEQVNLSFLSHLVL